MPVKVTPKSAHNQILPYATGDEALHLKVKPLPDAGKANAAVIALLAEVLKLPKRRVTLASGHQSRYKQLAIQTDPQHPPEALLIQLADVLGCPVAQCFSGDEA